MATRGLFGFKTGKDYFLSFRANDSYPAGLGRFWFNTVKEYDLNQMKEVLDNVSNFTVIPESNIYKDLKEFLELESEEKAKKIVEDYDNLVEESNSPFDILYEKKTNIFLNDKIFMRNGLFCEWVYYYDYTKEVFVILDNREEEVTKISLDDKDWQKNFKMV